MIHIKNFINKKKEDIKINDITYNEFYIFASNYINSSEVLRHLFNPNNIIISIDYVLNNQCIKISELQNKLNIGYSSASRLLDLLEDMHMIGPSNGSKPRSAFVSNYKQAITILTNYKCNKELLDQYNDLIIKQEETTIQEKITTSLESVSNGLEFENYCANLLTLNGYQNVTLTKASNDYGIDILAENNGVKYAIQCKFYTSPVGNSAVQEACAGKLYYNCHVAIVLTNSVFTKNAIELANKNNVILWDTDKLNELYLKTKKIPPAQ